MLMKKTHKLDKKIEKEEIDKKKKYTINIRSNSMQKIEGTARTNNNQINNGNNRESFQLERMIKQKIA